MSAEDGKWSIITWSASARKKSGEAGVGSRSARSSPWDKEQKIYSINGNFSLHRMPVRSMPLIAIVVDLIKAAHAEWQEALANALESASPAEAHAFRIKTKHLRYRLELARDLGADELRMQLDSLKSLQDRLGEWHDRAELA